MEPDMHKINVEWGTADGEFAVAFIGDNSMMISLKDTKSPQIVKAESGHIRNLVKLAEPFIITTSLDADSLSSLIDTAIVAGFSGYLSLYHENGKFHWLVAEEMTNDKHHMRIMSDWILDYKEESGKHKLEILAVGKMMTIGDHTADRVRPISYRSIQGPISMHIPKLVDEPIKDPVAAGFPKKFDYLPITS
jgi:hypothetical protein